MPEIGRPAANANQFRNIQIANAPKKEQTKNVGEQLNEVAGSKGEEQRFVDKEKHNKMDKDGFLKLLACCPFNIFIHFGI